jgi:hypothetical protein
MGMVYGVRDLSRVRWLGDDRLEAFQSNWFTVINQLRTPMTEGQLAEVLLELLDQSKEMKEDIAAYRRMIAQDLTKSFDYQYLLIRWIATRLQGSANQRREPVTGYRERR